LCLVSTTGAPCATENARNDAVEGEGGWLLPGARATTPVESEALGRRNVSFSSAWARCSSDSDGDEDCACGGCDAVLKGGLRAKGFCGGGSDSVRIGWFGVICGLPTAPPFGLKKRCSSDAIGEGEVLPLPPLLLPPPFAAEFGVTGPPLPLGELAIGTKGQGTRDKRGWTRACTPIGGGALLLLGVC